MTVSFWGRDGHGNFVRPQGGREVKNAKHQNYCAPCEIGFVVAPDFEFGSISILCD